MREPYQYCIRFRSFPIAVEEGALNWWSSRYTKGEQDAGNPAAIRNPSYYAELVKERFEANDDLVDAIVGDWHKAAAEGTLNEPIWSKPKMITIPKAKAASVRNG